MEEDLEVEVKVEEDLEVEVTVEEDEDNTDIFLRRTNKIIKDGVDRKRTIGGGKVTRKTSGVETGVTRARKRRVREDGENK